MNKIYVSHRPQDKPIPEFQWNGYNGKKAKYKTIPGIEYFKDEIGYYYIIGELKVI